VSTFPVILSAPSGAGKTTIARRLLTERSDVGYSISVTTRAPRPGEVDGVDYHFVSVDEFHERRRRGDFAEFAEVHGRWYATPRSEVERVLAAGKHVMMDIDVQGARQFSRAFPDSRLVFIIPPSAAALRSRLLGRQTESDEAMGIRWRGALAELAAAAEYDYVVVNDSLDAAIARVSAIIDAESSRFKGARSVDPSVRTVLTELQQALAVSVPE
jgi:guanylate kinase